MICIADHHTDPYFNLAAEEYILKNFLDDCFMLWRNEPSIIIGKHQNTLSEINLDFVRERGIKVVRRISGGGAVYHDLGNLNFSFIVTGNDENLVNFRKYTQPVIDVLKIMGIDAKFEGRNDLTIGSRKISGNAEHVWKNRILHHGTLLFSAILTDLASALNSDPGKFMDKAVKSIRSRVTNISEHIKTKMGILEFRDRIMDHIMKTTQESKYYQYSPKDIAGIEKLRKEKYLLWDWNYGYSPRYDFEKKIRTKGGNLEFHLNVDKGYIKAIRIFGDFFFKNETGIVERSLTGIRHDKDAILAVLSGFDINDYFRDISIDEFIEGMF